MAKVAGNYGSIILGVSQQSPQDRRGGQMWEQVNMISDPVRGVSRRPGSQYLNSKEVSFPVGGALDTDFSKYLVKSVNIKGVDYDILYARRPLTVGGGLSPVHVYDKTNNKFLNVDASGPLWDSLSTTGTSAVVNIGNYVFMSAAGWVPSYSTEQAHTPQAEAKDIAIWVRNGDYGRDYTVNLVLLTGVTKTVTYTTPKSTYQGSLDTSSVPVPTLNTAETDINKQIAEFNAAMSQYNAQVANITNAYNTAVTKHIGEAAAAIQPDAIAQQLMQLIKSTIPLTDGQISISGSYLFINKSAGVRSGDTVAVADSYIKSVFNDVVSQEDLIPRHFYGKVVKIQPKKSTGRDALYMKAEPLDGAAGVFGPVSWKECAGVVVKPESVFLIATVVGDTFYIRSTPVGLEAASGLTDVPYFENSNVGDLVSAPVPGFLKNSISYMGVFQDRLIIGFGSTIFASRPGDYFNWFRQSILDVLDNDPVEMYALGSETDIIQWDVPFDRNLVLFGTKYQYLISGKSALTPKNPNIVIMSTLEDAVLAPPQSSGSLVFYGRDLTTKGSIHQMQVGATSDSVDSYECSQQLDSYIKGKPIQIMCTQSPWHVIVRTTGLKNGIYLYSYLDSAGNSQRMFDSWSRWEWDVKLGACIGVSKYEGNINVYTTRVVGDRAFVVCDLFSTDTAVTRVPYVDSWVTLGVNPEWYSPQFDDYAAVGYNEGHDYYMLGTEYTKLDKYITDWQDDADNMTLGIQYPAYVTLTSPYLRDKDDKPILGGRLTVSSVDVTVADTGALDAFIELPDREAVTPGFDGRLLTRKGNLAGRSPMVNRTVKIPVYKEIRDYKLRLEARDWLPLTITGVEWVGQLFNRVKRV